MNIVKWRANEFGTQKRTTHFFLFSQFGSQLERHKASDKYTQLIETHRERTRVSMNTVNSLCIEGERDGYVSKV